MGDLSKDLIASDALVGLTDKLKATDGWQYDDLEASATKEFSRDGTLYAYPFSTSPFALYVNTDLLAKAKQKIDRKTLTWDQVAAARRSRPLDHRKCRFRRPGLRLQVVEHAGHGMDRLRRRRVEPGRQDLHLHQPRDAAGLHLPARRRVQDEGHARPRYDGRLLRR